MEHDINLMNSQRFRWFNNQKHKDSISISVKGFAYYRDHYFYDIFLADYLSSYFKNVNIEDIISEKTSEFLSSLNGNFVVVIKTEKWVFACTDRVRSIPLFYCVKDDKLIISDNTHWIKKQLNNDGIDEVSAAEFLLTGYVTGNETLVQNVRQLQAGECLFSNGNKLKTFCYFVYRHGSYFEDDDSQLIEQLHQKHICTFKRLIKSLDGRTAVIPLSGGHDSRLIVFMLKGLGYEKVICFSYGVPGNKESEISRKVANYLGYPWQYIPYSNEMWAEWSKTEEWKAYFTYADGLASLPHIQDWPAVWELKNKKIIPDDCIFIPGHTYDFITGGHIPANIIEKKEFSRKEIAELIIQKHYSLWDWSVIGPALQKTLKQKIYSQIDDGSAFSPAEAADIFEYWDWQERQAKFICNSLRVYEFWGYDWRIPLWDMELMNYWSQVPLDKRYERKLFFAYVNAKQEPLNKLLGNEPEMNRYDIKVPLRFILNNIGLLPLSRNILSQLEHKYKKRQWEREYSGHAMGWYGALDKSFFRNNYSGIQNINSYLALLHIQRIIPTY